MSKRLQRAAARHAYPEWMRVLAVMCLLLVGGVSSAQAAHVHGQWLPNGAAQVGALADASQMPGGEEHCPLCVAMHSALPVTARVETLHLVLVDCKVLQVVDRVMDATWHFARFSRPPPVVGNA